MAEAIYTTRRTMLIEERNRLSQAIADAFGALTALMNGKITSYSLGRGRSRGRKRILTS